MASTLVVVTEGFNGYELWKLLHWLQERGHTYEIVSNKKVIWDDFYTGQKYSLEKDYWAKDIFDHDGLVVISGNPKLSRKMWHDDRVLSIAYRYREKPLASICTAVPAIRRAAVGKKVTCFPLVNARILLRDEGAILTRLSVCVDGNLVTAESREKVDMWANFFCDVLEGKTPEFNLYDSNYEPKGKPRYIHPEIRKLWERTESDPRGMHTMFLEEDSASYGNPPRRKDGADRLDQDS